MNEDISQTQLCDQLRYHSLFAFVILKYRNVWHKVILVHAPISTGDIPIK